MQWGFFENAIRGDAASVATFLFDTFPYVKRSRYGGVWTVM